MEIGKLKGELFRLHPKDAKTVALLREIIQKQEALIEELMTEKDQLHSEYSYVCQDRLILLTENSQLKQKIQQLELNQSLQLGQFIKKQEEGTLPLLFFHRPTSTPLQAISPARPQNLLMDTLPRSERSPEDNCLEKTPILNQLSFQDTVFRTNCDLGGLLRAFYLSGLRQAELVREMEEIIEIEYKFGGMEGKWLFEKLPDNEVIGDLTLKFLKQVKRFSQCAELAANINKNQFYDDVLLQLLTHKLASFQINLRVFDQTTVKECFLALCHTFNLQLKVELSRFFFLADSFRKAPPKQSEINPYEQISLNPKPQDSLACPPKEDCVFVIDYLPEEDCFEFVVRDYDEPESVLESDYELSRSKEIEFSRIQQSESRGIRECYNHFVNVASVLSSPQESAGKENQVQNCSKELYLEHRRKLEFLRQGMRSNDTILLSGYNSNRVSKEVIKIKEFSNLKEKAGWNPAHSSKERSRQALSDISSNQCSGYPEEDGVEFYQHHHLW